MKNATGDSLALAVCHGSVSLFTVPMHGSQSRGTRQVHSRIGRVTPSHQGSMGGVPGRPRSRCRSKYLNGD